MDSEIFDRYTSTQMLAGENEAALTESSAFFFRQFILPHLPEDRGAVILDCGCGYGRYLKALRDAGYAKASGVDISAEQVAYARNRLGLADVHCADAQVFLGDRHCAYDAILLMDILEHLDVDGSLRLIAAARAALKGGGTLVVVAPNALTPMNVYRYSDLTHQRSYTVKSLAQSLRLGGFENFRFLPLPPPVHSVASAARRLVWSCLVDPAVRILVRVCHGPGNGKVFTGNILALATKEST